MKIPPQYLPVMPYLIVNDAKGFLAFAIIVFDASEQLIVPDSNEDIRHGEIRIEDAVIMFAQASENWAQKTAGMFLYVNAVNTVYEKALREGAKSLQVPKQQEYGYAAGFEDPFGNQWWINQAE